MGTCSIIKSLMILSCLAWIVKELSMMLRVQVCKQVATNLLTISKSYVRTACLLLIFVTRLEQAVSNDRVCQKQVLFDLIWQKTKTIIRIKSILSLVRKG